MSAICQPSIEELLGRPDLQWLQDPALRLASGMYLIKPEGGGDPCPFYPREVQKELLSHLVGSMDPIYLIKSRRMGMSTAVGVAMSDFAAWMPGVECNLVDQTIPLAHKKSENIIQTPLKGLKHTMPELEQCMAWDHDMPSHLKIRWSSQAEAQASSIYCGMDGRGSDIGWYWISEAAVIAATPKMRQQWKRIKGGLPAARKGRQIFESTWAGGKAGGMWDLVKPLYEGKGGRGKILFFPWWRDPECISIAEGMDLSEVEEYFRTLEGKLARSFSREQKAFYLIQQREQKEEVVREFPSTLEEALSTPGLHPKFETAALDALEPLVSKGKELIRWGELQQQSHGRPQFVPTSEQTGWFRMWHGPEVGMHYLLPADFCTEVPESDGEKDDFDSHAVPMLRAAHREPVTGAVVPPTVVAAIRIDERCDLLELARRISLMAAFYGDALVVPEINKHEGYCHLLRQAGVQNIFRRTLHPDDPAKGKGPSQTAPGWKTTSATKPVIIENLAGVLRERQLILYCPRMLAELRVYQQSLEALSGHHDDWVMALAIGLYNIRSATPYREAAMPMLGAPGFSGVLSYGAPGLVPGLGGSMGGDGSAL